MRVPVTDLVGTPGASRDVHETVVRADLDGTSESDTDTALEGWGPAADVVQDPIEVALTLDAITEGILARGTVDVDLVVPCSRCLEAVNGRVRIGDAMAGRRDGPGEVLCAQVCCVR